MGIQEVKKLRNQHRHDMRVEDHRQDGKKVWVLGLAGIALPLQQLKPVKTGRRRHSPAASANEEECDEEEEVEGAVTPTGEGCRIPAEAATCPPAPKKPRTAVAIISSGAGRWCNCDDGEVLEFFRVPADLETVFVSRAANAN
ncbi:cyclin-dependent protein kinase inhibitor SMR6-like isoform X2 [Phragmites australis]|uniref:cyclin-dependent protein kinase inhibitor SMR6-like isoform X2 n=1 Tax=Phragmites australis TaxID=29695 RepID=UPI002D76B30A|nr:cyclin-dependent protein kinase inhibitor SMR6-like isoform X2 [Phragmites australis]